VTILLEGNGAQFDREARVGRVSAQPNEEHRARIVPPPETCQRYAMVEGIVGALSWMGGFREARQENALEQEDEGYLDDGPGLSSGTASRVQ